MARAVWIVAEQGYEDGDIVYGVFSTRKKMLEALARDFEELSLTKTPGGAPAWGQFKRSGWVYSFTFTRVNLDKWVGLRD